MQTLPGCPDPDQLDARLALAQLRERMFHASTPVLIDRYRLLRLLGRGAHGRVFEAEDTELNRTIALKLMRADDPTPQMQRARLREAQSLAQLSHPNVVAVYDVGLSEGQLWIAMELVRGCTLAQWAERHALGSPEFFARARAILDQGASGLAAAHERGLVHRDFKPANVLVGDDGRVRVADFGLARARSTQAEPLEFEFDTSMTAVAGTPRYMSPEQLRGDRIDASSDQFGFAVTAWELLFGVHPFAGLSPTELAHEGDVRPVVGQGSTVVPPSVVRALRRALAPDPDHRFASMDDLRRALSRRARPLGGWAGAIVGTAVLATTMLLAGHSTSVEPSLPSCEPEVARARLASVWNDRRRETVLAGLRGSGLHDPTTMAQTVVPQIDAYADAWVAQQVATCRARWISGMIDDVDLDVRTTCLRDGADTLTALLTHFESPQMPTASRAIAAVRSLAPPEHCARHEAAEEASIPGHAALSVQLAQTRADLAAARYSLAAAKAEDIAHEATGARLGTLAADAHEVAGIAWGELNDPRRFEAFEAAYYIAAELTDGRDLARHANSLAMQYAYHGALGDAEEWARHAEAGLRRHPDELQRIAREHVRGLVQLKRRELPAATATFEHVLEQLGDRSAGTEELAWLSGAALLLTHIAADRFDEGAALAGRLRSQTVEVLGPAHPRLARLSMALGRSARKRGDFAEAIEHLQEAVRLSEQGYGPTNPRTAMAYLNLGYAHLLSGDRASAEQNYRRGLAAVGDTHDPFRVRLLRGLAAVCSARADHRCAEARLQAAVSSARRVWPEGGSEFGDTVRALAEVLLERGSADEAAHHLRASLDAAGRGSVPDDLARTVVDLAHAQALGADVPELPALLERATSSCGASRSPWCQRIRAQAGARSGPDGRQ